MSISLKAARVNVNLSQAEASRLIGISVPTLIRYERGERLPKTRLLPKIAETYRIDLKDLNFLYPNVD